jgi:predicted DNA-binding transcriptional regulator AlpA
MSDSDENSLLDLKRVAQLLAVSRRTITNWVRRGLFPPPLRLGAGGRTLRWTPTLIINHLKEKRSPSPPPGGQEPKAG